MSNPTFTKISDIIRESDMPEVMKQDLILLFFRVDPERQEKILACLEGNHNALPIFAEFLTELELNDVNMGDTAGTFALLEKYLEKLKEIKGA